MPSKAYDVTNMHEMFNNASSFNQDLGNWAVNNVTNMEGMFRGALVFNQDISGWAIDGVEHMAVMFRRASAFDQNLGWCVGDDVFEYVESPGGFPGDSLPENAFSGTVCASTLCGVTQGSCPP